MAPRPVITLAASGPASASVPLAPGNALLVIVLLSLLLWSGVATAAFFLARLL
jgi:hypothetical protein